MFLTLLAGRVGGVALLCGRSMTLCGVNCTASPQLRRARTMIRMSQRIYQGYYSPTLGGVFRSLNGDVYLESYCGLYDKVNVVADLCSGRFIVQD